MRRRWTFACAVLPLILLMPLNAQKQTAKVGCFDKTAVVVAFYRSPLWAETLRGKKEEQRRAKEANDTAKLKELEEWGGTQQELAHKQLAGEAPITNIVAALQPAFVEIERATKVSQVVPAPYGGKEESVDVTDALLDWLKADERTRQVIRNARKNGK